MQVVGVDFGTTNVRISTWDSDGERAPEPQLIGSGGTTTMPAVVALRREPGGSISIIVGEDADSEEDVSNEVVVIRNIKRYALSSDRFVKDGLDARADQQECPKWPLTWWNPAEMCVEVLGEKFPVWELIVHILEEAFRRAGVGEGVEWRAGCPVHADLEYRAGLTDVIRRIVGKGDIKWIVEEPILFLILANQLGNLDGSSLKGSYIIYDFGGGSFDCALAEIEEGNEPMIVYGADGNPMLGGSDIDDMLTKRLNYVGQPDLLRKAKERLNAGNRSETLEDGTVVNTDDVDSALKDGWFVNTSLISTNDTYITAKALWKRSESEDDPPVGEVFAKDNKTGMIRFVWELGWEQLAEDVDGIILFGGPTRTQHFYDELSRRFGAEKIKRASEVLPRLRGVPDLDLVGISMGACYSYEDSSPPLYINRLPVHVTLEDLESGSKVEYKPFEHLAPHSKLFDEFISPEGLQRRTALVQSSAPDKTIQLTVTLPNNVVLCQTFVDKLISRNLIAFTLKLVIDRFGRIGVKQESEKASPKSFLVLKDTPWQTDGQRKALQRLFDQERRYAEWQHENGLHHPTGFPWEYPT